MFYRIVIAALLVATPVAAQQTSEVLQHYRAYTAALESGDLALAESEAEQALAASEARDGDGGRTAVLAFNLAHVRLMTDDQAEAVAPAERAAILAETRSESGVDTVFAQVILQRARLAADGENADERLLAALNAFAAAQGAKDDIYPGAVELGRWAFEHREYSVAREAWSMAAGFAPGEGVVHDYAYGSARLSEGGAIFLREIAHRDRSLRRDSIAEISAAFGDAVRTLGPLAEIEPADGMTRAQYQFAEALAWWSAFRAKVLSDGDQLPREAEGVEGDADGMLEMAVLGADVRPRCMSERVSHPHFDFPDRALDDGQVGAVVVRHRLNESGEVVESRVVARVGSPLFAQEVESAASGHWAFARNDNSPPNCRMAMTVFQSISFAIRP